MINKSNYIEVCYVELLVKKLNGFKNNVLQLFLFDLKFNIFIRIYD